MGSGEQASANRPRPRPRPRSRPRPRFRLPPPSYFPQDPCRDRLHTFHRIPVGTAFPQALANRPRSRPRLLPGRAVPRGKVAKATARTPRRAGMPLPHRRHKMENVPLRQPPAGKAGEVPEPVDPPTRSLRQLGRVIADAEIRSGGLLPTTIRCFNGAASLMTRKYVPTSCSSPAAMGFNGAASSMTRKPERQHRR